MNNQYELSCKEFGLRLARLRSAKGVSARQMSLDIGQNKNYINSIETGHNFPTMQNFFDICQYLCIPPHRFFQEKSDILAKHEEFLDILYHMPPHKYHHLYQIACDLAETEYADNSEKL